MVDAEAVRRRLGKLDALVRRLRPYGAMDPRVFEADEVGPRERIYEERAAEFLRAWDDHFTG